MALSERDSFMWMDYNTQGTVNFLNEQQIATKWGTRKKNQFSPNLYCFFFLSYSLLYSLHLKL